MSSLVNDLRRRITKDFGPSAVLARPIEGSASFSYTAPDQIMVEGSANDREMFIDFVAVTDEDDREGDTIDPMGCMEYIGEYERNAAWLVEHDAKEQIAVCRASIGGPLTIRIEKSNIVARPYYNRLRLRGNRLSEEFYLLAKNGLFIGASPGFLPIEAKKRGYGKSDGYLYKKWRLTEFSQTSQPVNQSALRMSLSRGVVKSLGLKRRLESLLIKPNPVVVGGWGSPLGKAMSKPKTASIEFDKETFADEAACVAWLDSHGKDSSSCTPLPTSFVFKQGDGKPDAGKKSLGKGVTALLTKSFGKDEEKKKKPPKPDEKDEKPPANDKAKSEPDEDDDDDGSTVEDSDTEGDEPDSEIEEAEEGEDLAEDETDDPEALKAESEFFLDHIAQWEITLDHAKAKGSVAIKHPEMVDEMISTCDAFIKKIRMLHKETFSDQMMNDAVNSRKQDAMARQDTPADTAEPNEYDEAVKAMGDALKTTKSWPKVA